MGNAVTTNKMVEQLWYHALKFLDLYRTGDHNCHIDDLYQFVDETGILEIHKQCLAQTYEESQVNMKIMYYELIKMITSYERDHCKDQEMYDSTKSVGKIEGYQELTNKLQRFLNQRFIMDIEDLNKKHSKDQFEENENAKEKIGDLENISEKIGDLEKKFEALAEDNKKLHENCASLKSTNELLELEILKLKDTTIQAEGKSEIDASEKKEEFNSDSESSITSLIEKIDGQNKDIAKLDDKMEKIINQTNTLLINDATHLERICNMEKENSEFIRKLSDLESADLFLQESYRMMHERTALVEKYAQNIEEQVNLLTNEKHSEVTSETFDDLQFEQVIER